MSISDVCDSGLADIMVLVCKSNIFERMLNIPTDLRKVKKGFSAADI